MAQFIKSSKVKMNFIQTFIELLRISLLFPLSKCVLKLILLNERLRKMLTQ